jgi:TPP-dependent indolepyruvate ferredoxin oxidoreductase alpha subunit
MLAPRALSDPGRGDLQGAGGVNVASDALANLAVAGVTGGALIIVGEDYGEGSSIMQERSHAFAMKSQFWLLDPRPEPALDRRRWSRASSCPRPRTRR